MVKKKELLKGKYILSLNNFCPKTCIEKYTFNLKGDDFNEEEIIKDDIYTTDTIDIMQEKSDRYNYFLDSKKNKIKHWMHMIDFTKEGPLPLNINIPCWWCRELFITCPIGIPTRFWSAKNQNRDRIDVLEKLKELNIEVENNFEFFETEGIFCSFPCCKSYILENFNNPRYKNSLNNLSLLYWKLNKNIINIPQAPHWKFLKKWGGHLTIDQFRSSFSHNHLTYEMSPNKMQPFMFPISFMYTENNF